LPFILYLQNFYFFFKELFYDNEELKKWLGVLSKSSHLYELGSSLIFLVHYPNIVEEYGIHKTYKLNEKAYTFTWTRVIDVFNPKSEKLTGKIVCDKTIKLFLDINLQQLWETLQKESKQVYAFLNCEDDPDWENLYEGLYQGYLQRPGEKWKTYRVFLNELPSDEDVKVIKGKLSSFLRFLSFE
jgi:hypothetical protein